MVQPSRDNKIKKKLQPQVTNNVAGGNHGIGRMLLMSLVLHVVIFVLIGGYLVPTFEHQKKPVYYVDLMHKPVANPRAGRTDAAVKHKKKKTKKSPKKKIKKKISPKKVVKKVAKKKQPPVKKKVIKKPPAKKTLAKKVVPPKKPVSKPVVTKPVVTKPISQPPPTKKVITKYETNPVDAIEAMRRKQRIAALKNELKDLAHAPVAVSDAPVGVIGGHGTQAGVDYASWIKAFLSEAWALPSNYMERGLVGKMLLRFDRNGRQIYSELLAPSGDSFFDASIKRAARQLNQLPSKPGKQMELTITFDPKELLSQ